MHPDSLRDKLTHIPGVAATVTGPDSLEVTVAVDIPLLTLHPSRVHDARTVPGPTGEPALRLEVLDDTGAGFVLFVASDDLAFAPDLDRATTDVLPGRLPHVVSDLPPGVSYREMARDFARGPATDNLDHWTGQVLMLGAHWWGAHRAGIDVAHLRPDLDRFIDTLHRM